MSARKLVSVDYEVHGLVQGVFFRANTVETAKRLGLVGHVLNTNHGTVKGSVQGPQDKISEMKVWLETIGSPQSQIDRCDFTNEKEISKLTNNSFTVLKYPESLKYQ